MNKNKNPNEDLARMFQALLRNSADGHQAIMELGQTVQALQDSTREPRSSYKYSIEIVVPLEIFDAVVGSGFVHMKEIADSIGVLIENDVDADPSALGTLVISANSVEAVEAAQTRVMERVSIFDTNIEDSYSDDDNADELEPSMYKLRISDASDGTMLDDEDCHQVTELLECDDIFVEYIGNGTVSGFLTELQVISLLQNDKYEIEGQLIKFDIMEGNNNHHNAAAPVLLVPPPQKQQQNQQPQPQAPPSSPSAAAAKVSECVVCYDAESVMAIIPCGHKCVCPDCADMLDKCPLCKAVKQGVLKIFNS